MAGDNPIVKFVRNTNGGSLCFLLPGDTGALR
jgi:hypothetical protein